MDYNTFVGLLEDHGWDVDSDLLRFTRGNAVISIGWDEDDEPFIVNVGSLCYISWLKFTKRSMTIIWDDGDRYRYNYW